MANPLLVKDSRKKIVLIEGSGSFGVRLSEAFKSMGYDCTFNDTGKGGLKAIYDTLPHVIILDVVLPDMDGYEVLKQLQAEPLLKKIPLFLLSTQGVPINIGKIPSGSVKEFILTMHADTNQVTDRIKTFFGDHDDVIAPEIRNSLYKVLWIEKDDFLATILEKKMKKDEFDITRAKGSDEAFDLAGKIMPNVIVVDLVSLGEDGFDTLKNFQKDQRYKNIPVLVLLSMRNGTDAERARLLGANRSLVKAATLPEKIEMEIRGLCDQKRR